MMPVTEELEQAIRDHERLIISRQTYQAKLNQKTFVSTSFNRTLEMEIEHLRVALEAVEEEIAAVESRITALKAANNGNR